MSIRSSRPLDPVTPTRGRWSDKPGRPAIPALDPDISTHGL